MGIIAKLLPYVGLFLAFLVAALYSLRTEWTKDCFLAWTARAYGNDSIMFRLTKQFIDRPSYTYSMRIVAGLVAICLLALLIYLIASD